ncbi:hypothetical protein B0T24DRAFT_592355 [Lasiosphaeria ovina]|uniref:Nephrocystin 3-like N-terminal domain-containing protein n=1 Tax=Lasiosphaeria ovina TaxID=92902 RepID=A0AAE0KI57_9PEZI|nr:hypothetical protein B0T24DRAFT_592355 [Lasiosphaeria ovina]
MWLHAIRGTWDTRASRLSLNSSSAVYFLAKKMQGHQIGVCYFYFDFQAQEKRATCGMLRSLVAQLSQTATKFPPEVNELYDRFKGRRSQPSPEELLDLLVAVATRNLSRVYVLVDAVNECNERGVLLPILERLAVSKTMSIMLSSRRERDILDLMLTLGPINVSLEADKVAGDVSIFLNKKMSAEPYLKTLSEDLRSTILETLLEDSNGMFRWVKCQLDLIKSLKRPQSIRNAIKTLPAALDETYERILCTVTGEDERCESLFVLTGEYVEIAHYSIQEYLTSDRIFESAASFFSIRKNEAMEEICLRCLTYMNYDDFNIGPASSQEDFDFKLEQFPLLRKSKNTSAPVSRAYG